MRRKVLVLEDSGELKEKIEEVIEELPLTLYINNELYGTFLRTPGEDKSLIAGICFTEGLIKDKNDILKITLQNNNTAEIKIRSFKKRKDKEHEDFSKLLDNIKSFSISLLKPHGGKITVEQLLKCAEKMESLQELRRKTKASHAVMLFSYDLEPIVISEDVGRHNAFDKAIGNALLKNKIMNVFLAVLSSRISLEMCKKGAMAGIKILMGMSKPTSLAVSLADAMEITIVSLINDLPKEKALTIYSALQRITKK